MIGQSAGDSNCNAKERHSNSYNNPQRAGHTNERNYLVPNEIFPSGCPRHCKTSPLEGWRTAHTGKNCS
jgi:hypothetical protein